MKNYNKITILLFFLLCLPVSFAEPFKKSFFDLDYLMYKFLENNNFHSFNKDGPEILINKPKPVIGDEVRIALTDKKKSKEIKIFLLNEDYQKKFVIKELSEGTGLFFAKIKITEKNEKGLTFPFSLSKILLFYNSEKPYVYTFGENEKLKEEEEIKTLEENKKIVEKNTEEQKVERDCKYYRSDEVEAFSDYMFIESTDPCEDLIAQYKDQLYNKAKEKAKKECDKITCTRTGCNCKQYFQEFPYEEERMECFPLTVRGQTRLSYTIEGACICKC